MSRHVSSYCLGILPETCGTLRIHRLQYHLFFYLVQPLHSANSGVPAVRDTAKCVSMHTHFQRCCGSQPLDHITSLYAGIHPLCAPCQRVWCVSFERLECSWTFNGLEFHWWKNSPRNFWFWQQNQIFFTQKIQYVAISYGLGWLVGWLLFYTTFRDICHPKK